MRSGYALGSSDQSPSLGTSPGLLIYDSTTKMFEVYPNPGIKIPPGQGQRPAAVRELASHGTEVVLVRPGALCPESYALARQLRMRFVVLAPSQAPDALMLNIPRDCVVDELSPSIYGLQDSSNSY